jgi:hypothetical protein
VPGALQGDDCGHVLFRIVACHAAQNAPSVSPVPPGSGGPENRRSTVISSARGRDAGYPTSSSACTCLRRSWTWWTISASSCTETNRKTDVEWWDLCQAGAVSAAQISGGSHRAHDALARADLGVCPTVTGPQRLLRPLPLPWGPDKRSSSSSRCPTTASGSTPIWVS